MSHFFCETQNKEIVKIVRAALFHAVTTDGDWRLQLQM